MLGWEMRYETKHDTESDSAMTIQRLDEGKRAALVAHFLALPMADRHLRFGTPFGATAIASYVDRINFAHDAVFGVHDDRPTLVAAAHVAIVDDLAEIGLSVLPAHRGHGVGSALFRRAVALARNRRVPRLFMHFLSENAPILRIARKFGMDIVARAGDTDAYLTLLPKSISQAFGAHATQETKMGLGGNLRAAVPQ